MLGAPCNKANAPAYLPNVIGAGGGFPPEVAAFCFVSPSAVLIQSSANASQSALALKLAWALADSSMHFCTSRQHSSVVM